MTTTNLLTKPLTAYSIKTRDVRFKLTKSRRGNEYNNNILISEANDYDMIINSREFIWKADNSRGTSFISDMYDSLPDGTKYVFILYTNTIKHIGMRRMTQDVWAFPDLATVKRLLPDMLDELAWVKDSHLLALPGDLSAINYNLTNSFIDPYYYTDCARILRKTLPHYSELEYKKLEPIVITAKDNYADFIAKSKFNRELFDLEQTIMFDRGNQNINHLEHDLAKRRKKFH